MLSNLVLLEEVAVSSSAKPKFYIKLLTMHEV